MADESLGPTTAGDVLRPVRTRASGTKAIAYYAVFGALALVAIVYLIGIFSAPTHDPPPAASGSSSRSGVAGEQFRYDGRVVSERAVPLHVRATPFGGTPPLATATAPAAANVVATLPSPLIAVPRIDVPDTSSSVWGTRRVLLPTPVPGEGGTGATAAPSPQHGIQVVYGAPTVATTPVPPGPDVPRLPPVRDPPTPNPTLRSETMPGVRRAPLARYLVGAGTEIPVQLDVALESDLPGPVRAHVVRDVVDSLSGAVLVPAGTAVLGRYASLAAGQSRLAVTWTRLLFPDRSSFALDNVPALDGAGQSGIGGRLDDHRGQVLRTTTFGGILAELARRIGAPAGTNVVIVNGAGSEPGLAQSLLDTANQLVHRDLAAAPTVTIPADTLVTLYVDRDMLFDAPYAPLEAAP